MNLPTPEQRRTATEEPPWTIEKKTQKTMGREALSIIIISNVHMFFITYTHSFTYVQTTLIIPTLDTTTKFVIMTIWLSQNLRLRGNI